MTNLIVELSKYALILLMAINTCMLCLAFRVKSKKTSDYLLAEMTFMTLLLQFVAHLVLYLKMGEQEQSLYFYVIQAGFLLVSTFFWKICYRNLNNILLASMGMMLTIGLIILTRIDIDKAIKQFQMMVLFSAVCLPIPVIIRKWKACQQFDWFYGVTGMVLLGIVLVLSSATYGANISFTIAGVTLQPSEFVKILFVFFVAARLNKSTEFREIVITTAAAAGHVLLLVASTDLGGALLFFVTYLVMLYVATKKSRYCFIGLGAGGLAGVLAYYLFSHVRVRVLAWSDPFSRIDKEGYQVAQSLFAIGTGGWTGMGLGQGMPKGIPFVEKDSIFSAISEEMGGIFAICLVMVCISVFISFFMAAMKVKNKFYCYVAMGFGAMYATQVFLTIGGAIKFIPLTGVTLPLISYGGSSLLSTLMIFGIVQGIYLIIRDEEIEVEKERKRIEMEEAEKIEE